MPPTSEATTAVAHAIASRFTIPNGSYPDGQTKTLAAESISRILLIGSISRTQNTPLRTRANSCTADVTSAAISAVSGAPAHNNSWMCGVCARTNRELDLWREVVARRDQMRDSLLPGDPPDESHDRAIQVEVELF